MKLQNHIDEIFRLLDEENWQEPLDLLRNLFPATYPQASMPKEWAAYRKINELAEQLSSFSSSDIERKKLQNELIDRLRHFFIELDKGKPAAKKATKWGDLFTRMLDPFIDIFDRTRPSKSPPKPSSGRHLPKKMEVEESKSSAEEMIDEMASEEIHEGMSGAEPPEEEAIDNFPLPFPDLQPISNVISPPASADIVNVSLYAPDVVTPDKRFLISAFAHLFEQREEVDSMAREADHTAVKQGAKTLNMPIQRGEALQFSLELEGWEIDEPVQQITWFGVPSSVEFIVRVPAGYTDDIAIGILIVSNQTGPVGRVKFNLTLGSEPAATPSSFAHTDSRTYQRAYLSYADEDLARVSHETQAYRNQSSFVFTQPFSTQDADWEAKTLKSIGESDLFVLFWSKAATRSQRVTTEWESALGLRYGRPERLPDILPVSLESPLPDPPGELAFLNFSDHFASVVAAESTTAAGSFPADSPVMLKTRCEELIADGDFKVFDLLTNHFAQVPEKLQELILLRMQWTTLKRKARLGLLAGNETQLEQNKIVFALLAMVGEIQ